MVDHVPTARARAADTEPPGTSYSISMKYSGYRILTAVRDLAARQRTFRPSHG